MKTIVLTGGGTAGHCTPHFALLDRLNNHFDKVYYIGSEFGIEKKLVLDKGLSYFEIPTTKLKRSFSLDNLKIPFTLIKSINEAKKILEKLNPNVVFSKGGFVGLPVTIASKKLKIPVIVHESDYSLGLANKIASKFSDKTLTSFEDTAKNVKNGVYVGAPIREELFKLDREKAIKFYGFSKHKPTLLVTGGSLGAKAINQAVLKSLDNLLEKFNVLHIVGKNNLTPTFFKGYFQVEFTNMELAYACADVCLSRAGSNTLFELLALKIPTLVVPLPKAESRGDQIENTNYFYKKGVIKHLEQEELNNVNLTNELYNLYENRKAIINKLSTLNLSNGNKNICDILTKY